MFAILTSVSFALLCPKFFTHVHFCFSLQAKLVFLRKKSVDWLYQGHPREGVGEGLRFLSSLPDLMNPSLALRSLCLEKSPRWHHLTLNTENYSPRNRQTAVDTGQGFAVGSAFRTQGRGCPPASEARGPGSSYEAM